MHEHHTRPLDNQAFQSSLFAAIGRTPPAPIYGSIRRLAGDQRHRPSVRGVLTALAVTAIVLAVSAAPAAGQAGTEDIVAVQAVTGLAAVATGDGHSCAVTSNHQAVCWGANDNGQLGVGEAGPSQGASVVANRAGTGPLIGVSAVTTGAYHSCALLTSHEVRCWGSSSYGQIGDGAEYQRVLPVPVLDVSGTGHLRDVVQLSGGGNTTCATLATGEVRCWGDDDDGQIGDAGTSLNHDLPTPVRAVTGAGRLRGVSQIEVAPLAVCARLTSGEARCWGNNVAGQLGDGSADGRTRPVVVRNAAGTGALIAVRRISVGDHHACAVRTDGTARCWGDNGSGQLGNGTNDPHPLPVAVVADSTRTTPLRGIAALDAGSAHSCARLTNGQVRCWGGNQQDQLGNGIEAGLALSIPSAVRNRQNTGNLGGVAQLSTHTNHTCVHLTNGQARCWGYGQTGALGDLGTANQPLPRVVVQAEAA